ncbi:uncharacterized protein LOC132048114 isoform X2 [Lycium ferocissimum]|uniref:uncharacterized protein LOC132048114 isoform X2 n=1 Tax=Lycium ferocissimum TaxID=112874 RepID=UPI002816112B|nr:uncharacterized protein LOC132048114 isoform X2 [Lycium ferocissimum]
MKQQENKDLVSSLPVIPRLDRLDFLILEEKHGLSGRNFSASVIIKKTEEEDEYCKTLSLSSALEEVNHKGTLIERLTALENRILKLSLEMDEGNTSRSSSSKSRDDKDEKANFKQKQLEEEALITEAASLSTGKTDKAVGDAKIRRKSYRKWRLGWLHLGCN